METVTNAASAAATTASKYIWGENSTAANETGGREPISGAQGKGTATEPYDQGNEENPTSTVNKNLDPVASSTSTTNDPTAASSTLPSASEKPQTNIDNAANKGVPRPEHETDKTGVVGNMSDSAKASDIRPSETAENPGAAPESGAPPKQKQQGADAPLKAPEEGEQSAVKETKDEGEEALKKRDPNDHSGEPLKVHNEGEVGNTQEERRESKAGNPGGQEHGKDEEKGTGEQWVKTSGLQADGGDFDATKPGAGREADRLLEQKGIHKSEPGKPTPEPSHDSKDKHDKSDKGDKPSLSEKLKDKLHLGHKDK